MLSALIAIGLSTLAPQVPFEKAATEFLNTHGYAGKKADEVEFDAVLEKHFVAAHLGLFDVRFPVEGLEKHASELTKCAQALLGAQEHLLDWLKPNGTDQKAVREDLKAIQKWVGGLREAQLQKLKDGAGKDWMDLLPCPDATKAAQKELAEALGSGSILATKRDAPESLRLVLEPTRKGFVELVCFAGWQNEADRGLYWADGVTSWMSAFVRADQVIALEYSVAGAPPNDYGQGTAMGESLPQQVVQLALNLVFERFYADRAPSAFVQGLSMNLVIELFGEVNTRVDGDTRGRQTQKREVFVPGGNADGGRLGKNSADTRWRELQGADHFLKILKLAQKEGGEADKKAKNRLACFGLRDDKGTDVRAVTAPFFGAAAGDKQVPESYQGDFAECLRAYKSAFLYWMQTQAGGPDKKSREKFAQFLCKLADPAAGADFEAVFAQVYEGVALSNAECDKNCLEGRFLAWLPGARDK